MTKLIHPKVNQFSHYKKYKIPASIELEYDIPAGSDAVKETKKCFEYAKAILEG